jgi:hypothetical protein
VAVSFIVWLDARLCFIEEGMTDEQIEEGQKLIAGMRADLARLAGATDADELIGLLSWDKWMGLMESFVKLVGVTDPALKLGSTGEADGMQNSLIALWAFAERAQRQEEHKAKLVEKVGKEMLPRIEGLLEALRVKAGM